MTRLIVLGSAAAVADSTHDNTHFLLEGDQGSAILVDCGSNPVGKLERYGMGPDDLTHLILTHFHPDHVYGVPILLMQLWLLGRTRPLAIYGLHHCLHRVERMLDDYLFETWPNFFELTFHRVAERSAQPLLSNDDFHITAWPTRHFIPTIGLRIQAQPSGYVVGYSGDTEPIPNIVALGRDADLFIHEAAGAGYGHSSAAQAGEMATQARAKRLVLIHYPVLNTDPRPLVDEARTTYSGPVELAEDYDEYPLGGAHPIPPPA